MEHEPVASDSEWERCAGSLVTQRTVITSAWCARATRHSTAVAVAWALAVGGAGGRLGAESVRRVVRVASAGGVTAVTTATNGGGEYGPARDWAGALFDLALLELEAPFGGGGWRPILMATDPSDCERQHASCQTARARADPRLAPSAASVEVTGPTDRSSVTVLPFSR